MLKFIAISTNQIRAGGEKKEKELSIGIFTITVYCFSLPAITIARDNDDSEV
jgi:hypothetical protein